MRKIVARQLSVGRALWEVQRALRHFQGVRDARLIDAHSLCWMLIRLKLPAATPPTVIPMPVLINSLKRATVRESEIDDEVEFHRLSE